MNEPFRFKQFTIHQDQCAMKVGTDGVLLGAWTSLENQPNSILDVGAGTGLIALQMAQRSTAETIDAVEQDSNAFEQCVNNFEVSKWIDRLFCFHASFVDYIVDFDDSYDLIVSNPPFYSEKVLSGNTQRDEARQTQSLPFELLLEGCSKLLTEKGEFAVIIPFKDEEHFVGLASKNKLFPNRITHVKGNPDAPIKRSLMQFSFKRTNPTIETLVIETERHQFTQDYINLTKEFYLKM